MLSVNPNGLNIVALYHGIVAELCLFDEAGGLRNRQEAEGNMEAALDLLDSLVVSAISSAVTNIRRTLPRLLAYFEVAAKIVPELHQQLGRPFGHVCPSCGWRGSGANTR